MKNVTENEGKNLFFFCFYLTEAIADGLPCPENVYFYLLLADAEYGGNVTITLFFDVTELHTAALLLRQTVDKAPYQLYAVSLYDLLFR